VILDCSLVYLGPVGSDVRAGEFIAGTIWVWYSDDSRIGNERMRQKKRFELSWGHLEAFVLDKLLQYGQPGL
jgi:hypothetical protein